MIEKITGYSLLAVGIAAIVFAAFNVYFVFTKQALPIQVFNFPAVSMELVPGTKPVELVSADMLNQSSNLLAHLLLMGFIASIGQKLASLGVQLLRPIVVKVKEG
ncbi:MAG: hypothetical protein M1484_01415 [Patescibacteria group bacterium]|nr:hypothetical protein [Patescibacteria group bacterium]MCL5431740.1 hypothetical protein [Patescibacteria group bacterium]